MLYELNMLFKLI